MRLDAATLYRLCREGNEEAWQTLQTWCRIRASKMMPGEADDVSQNVVLKLLEGGLDRLRDPRAFLGYVRRAVDNEIHSRLRVAGRTLSLDQPLASDGDGELTPGHAMAGGSPSPEGQAGARLAMLQLLEVFEQLPAYCEGVMKLYLRYRMGLVESYKEMATLLKVSVNTLGVQIKRCLDQLRQLPVFAGMFEGS